MPVVVLVLVLPLPLVLVPFPLTLVLLPFALLVPLFPLLPFTPLLLPLLPGKVICPRISPAGNVVECTLPYAASERNAAMKASKSFAFRP